MYFQCYALWWKSFHLPVQKRRGKCWRVSNFALLLVIFKWHHSSERVKGSNSSCPPLRLGVAGSVLVWNIFDPIQPTLRGHSMLLCTNNVRWWELLFFLPPNKCLLSPAFRLGFSCWVLLLMVVVVVVVVGDQMCQTFSGQLQFETKLFCFVR